jgi:hypothetical protein
MAVTLITAALLNKVLPRATQGAGLEEARLQLRPAPSELAVVFRHCLVYVGP